MYVLLGFHAVPREIPRGFSSLLFLIMTEAVVTSIGIFKPPGLDKLRFGPARVADSS